MQENVHNKIDDLRKTYLRYLLEYVRSGDPHSNVFRTFVDNWFAYYTGGSFLKTSLAAKWFNRADLKKKPDAIAKFHLCSVRAKQVIDGIVEWEDLVKDHCIPLSILRKKLCKANPTTIEDVERILIQYYKIGLITQEENAKLNARRLRSEMPIGVETSPNARYESANIALVGP
jgi:hypothetical protein